VRACVRSCVRACVRARVRVCVCVCTQVCFSQQLDSVVLFEYLGPLPATQQHRSSQQHGTQGSNGVGFDRCVRAPPATCAPSRQVHPTQLLLCLRPAAPALPTRARLRHPPRTPARPLLVRSGGQRSFFRERWRLPLCSASEQLSRDFCVSLRNGAHLLLASTTTQRGDAAAAAAAAAAGAAGAGGGGAGAAAGAPGAAAQQQAPLLADPLTGEPGGGGSAAVAGQLARNAPSSDCTDLTTFHVVRAAHAVGAPTRVCQACGLGQQRHRR
jgi:hypothetical protein